MCLPDPILTRIRDSNVAGQRKSPAGTRIPNWVSKSRYEDNIALADYGIDTNSLECNWNLNDDIESQDINNYILNVVNTKLLGTRGLVILKLYYIELKTMAEIGTLFHITKERARVIRDRTLRKLRNIHLFKELSLLDEYTDVFKRHIYFLQSK